MSNQPRCGNCGRFGVVKYGWRGPSYSEVFHCEHCPGGGHRYDPWAKEVSNMTTEEIKDKLL
jgi:hypothetical protein